ncbi:uncharacterized protein LOC128870292 [Anastrepha ludens]|uniref:uncharacterized protein LOC128870292 n=1 Tax=Anastrepha ludens TaxID=28586 RepID=UPI0023B12695|nr:uncharacterized protein LOC128870292 [Anastrepha ludens]
MHYRYKPYQAATETEFSTNEQQISIILAEQIDDSTFTRVVGNCSSSPDITIASAGLINSITWRPMLSLASDHLPIIISIEKPVDFVSADHRSYINFNKADWTRFAEFTGDIFAALPTPTDVRAGERAFRKAITAAAARFIPAGRIRDIRPNFPAEAAVLANERDRLRQADPRDPRIKDLYLEIRQLVTQHKRTKWVEHLKSCNLTSDVSKLWSTVRSLSNPTKHNDKVDIAFNQINRGLNQNRPCERTVLVALDLKKAFDTVSHSTLVDDIYQLSPTKSTATLFTTRTKEVKPAAA